MDIFVKPKSQPRKNIGCICAAVEILGEKWTPQIIHALASESMRFCKLQDSVGSINPRTLSARLVRLEAYGIIHKTIYSEIPPHTEYSLTDKGNGLVPILQQMASWSRRYDPLTDQHQKISK